MLSTIAAVLSTQRGRSSNSCLNQGCRKVIHAAAAMPHRQEKGRQTYPPRLLLYPE